MTATLYGAPPRDQAGRIPIPMPSDFMPYAKPVDAPPPYAPATEQAAIAMLEKLEASARARVLRYAISKWPDAINFNVAGLSARATAWIERMCAEAERAGGDVYFPDGDPEQPKPKRAKKPKARRRP